MAKNSFGDSHPEDKDNIEVASRIGWAVSDTAAFFIAFITGIYLFSPWDAKERYLFSFVFFLLLMGIFKLFRRD